MKISLCLITKDEERHIKKCINSVANIVDEIIVVDTGSTDKTVEIAKELGAKIINFEWVNDFSKARNYAIEQCTGNWIIFLDADEYLKEDCQEALLNQIKVAHSSKKDAIFIELINIDEMTEELHGVMKNIRVFKKTPVLRYVKPIHERLEHLSGKIDVLDASKYVKLYHTGYSRNIVKEKNKSQRNLDLLFKQLEKNPTSSDVNYYIAESFLLEYKYEEAIEYCDQVDKYHNSTSEGAYTNNKLNKLMCLVGLNANEARLIETYEEAIRVNGIFPDYDYVVTKYYLDKNNLDKAEEYLLRCIDKMNKYNGITEAKCFGHSEHIFEILARVQIHKNQLSNAISTLVNIIKYNKYHVYAGYQLIKILSEHENNEKIYSFLVKIYDFNSEKDRYFVIEIAKSVGNEQLVEKLN